MSRRKRNSTNRGKTPARSGRRDGQHLPPPQSRVLKITRKAISDRAKVAGAKIAGEAGGME